MERTFNKDLQRNLGDPEFTAYFIEAQIESAQELLKAGIIDQLTIGSMRMSKTEYEDSTPNWKAG